MTEIERLQADFKAMQAQQVKDSAKITKLEGDIKVLRYYVNDTNGDIFDALSQLVEPEFWDMPVETEH